MGYPKKAIFLFQNFCKGKNVEIKNNQHNTALRIEHE